MPNTICTRPRRYFGFHYMLLRCTGLGWWHHPDENDTRNFPGWYLYYSFATQIIWVAGFVGLETIDPFVGDKELESFMFSLSFVITHNLTIIKLYLFFFKNKEIQDIVRIIEIDLHDYYQNENTNRKTIKICKTFTFAFIFFGWLTIGNSNTYGAIQDIHWKTSVRRSNDSTQMPPRSLAQPIYIPWDYQKDQSYIPTFILELVGLLWTGHIVMGIDTFIGSVILHMSSQFVILKEAIETAYDRTMIKLREGTVYDADENLPSDGTDISLMNLEENNERIVRAFYTEKQIESALQTTLVNCIRQHQVLVGCVEKFSTTYSYGFMTQLLSSMAAICVVMVQVSVRYWTLDYFGHKSRFPLWPAYIILVVISKSVCTITVIEQDASSFKSLRLITSLAFFAAMIIQLAIQCFTGNELTLQASRISDAVMQCKWERLTPRLRSLMMLTMMRAQRPLRLSAAGFAHMDNACFLAVRQDYYKKTLHPLIYNVIMKAAYSYYAVLSQKQV